MLALIRSLRRDADCTLSCRSLGEIRNRDVANWRKAEHGRLRWSGHVFEIRWRDGRPLVSGGASSAQCDVVAAVLLRRCDELAEESLHRPRHGNPAVRLNAAITFLHAKHYPIACRHLVVYWLRELFDSGPEGPDYPGHFTATAVRQRIGQHSERVFNDAKRLCAIRIVANADWGAHLRDRFNTLRRRGETETAYVLLTPDHAMAIALRILQRDGRPVHQVCFYEPSETATHVQAMFEDTESMLGLAAGHFTNAALPPPAPNGAAPNERKFSPDGDDAVDAMLWVEVGPAQLRMLESRNTPAPDVPRPLSGPLPAPTADAIWHLLRYGCVDALHRVAPAFRRLPDQERIARLQYRGRTTAFFDVVSLGHPDTVAAFGKLIEGLPVRARAELLQAKHRDGRSAFSFVLGSRRQAMIAPFWQLVRRHLPADWHYAVMRAEQADGTSALHRVLATDDAKVMMMFAWATEDMPTSLFAALMAERGPDGESGLMASIRNPYTRGAVAAAFDVVLKRLPGQARAALLEPAWRHVRSLEGTPGERPEITAAIRGHVQVYAPSLLHPAPAASGGATEVTFPGIPRPLGAA